VIRTRVGYAGGTTDSPTYQSIGDHAETIQIDYDPRRLTYAELLDHFWHGHDPFTPAPSGQYRSIIFYHTEEQRRLAMESKQRLEAAAGRPVLTRIMPFERFYRAEPYHQKYYVRLVPPIEMEFRRMYPDPTSFTDSTALARVNGHVGGYGTIETFTKEIAQYGLSEAGQRLLKAIAYPPRPTRESRSQRKPR